MDPKDTDDFFEAFMSLTIWPSTNALSTNNGLFLLAFGVFGCGVLASHILERFLPHPRRDGLAGVSGRTLKVDGEQT
jgi:hypothetical protein